MRLTMTKEQIENVQWVEWHNAKHDTTTAHAIDPTSEARTGVLRAVNGAVVPASAIPARASTPRDPFSVSILKRGLEKLRHEEERAVAREARRKPRPDGVLVRGADAELWLSGERISTFPAERLRELPGLLSPPEPEREPTPEPTPVKRAVRKARKEVTVAKKGRKGHSGHNGISSLHG